MATYTAAERRARAEVRRLARILVEERDVHAVLQAHDRLMEMGPERPGWIKAMREVLHKGRDGWGLGALMAADVLGAYGWHIEELTCVLLGMLETATATDNQVLADNVLLYLQATGIRSANGVLPYLGWMVKFLTDPRIGAKMADAVRILSSHSSHAYSELRMRYWDANRDPEMRDRAEIIRGLLEEARAEAEALTIGAVSEVAAERAAAVESLAQTGCDSNLVLQTLLWLTGDPDEEVRAKAHEALYRLEVDREYNKEMAKL